MPISQIPSYLTEKLTENDMRDFIEQSKKNVKEVSDLAIKAIKSAHEDRTDVDSM